MTLHEKRLSAGAVTSQLAAPWTDLARLRGGELETSGN